MNNDQTQAPLSAVEAVTAVMAAVGAVGKDSAKQGIPYSWRGIDAVINALAGPMRTVGLVLCPHVVEYEVVPMPGRSGWTETRMTVEYDVIGPDGSTLPRPVRAFAIGADNSDKGPGKAMSRYRNCSVSRPTTRQWTTSTQRSRTRSSSRLVNRPTR